MKDECLVCGIEKEEHGSKKQCKMCGMDMALERITYKGHAFCSKKCAEIFENIENSGLAGLVDRDIVI